MDSKLSKIIDEWFKDTSKTLDIIGLELEKWPDELKGKENFVIKLNCSDNELTSIPFLPNLTWLCCFDTPIENIPVLPNLTYLDCDNTPLKSIPVLPKLTYLECPFTLIEKIPVLPNLTELHCSHTPLKSIPVLPNLIDLKCSRTNLFSNELADWKKIWKIQTLRKSELRKSGIHKLLKILKMRLYLPRLNNLHQELIYSPNHPGKFYKNLRIGNWSFENKIKLQNFSE